MNVNSVTNVDTGVVYELTITDVGGKSLYRTSFNTLDPIIQLRDSFIAKFSKSNEWKHTYVDTLTVSVYNQRTGGGCELSDLKVSFS